jgi:stage V sporulation protein G
MDIKKDKLKAFCSITINDDFVIRDLKIIEGSNGPFVAMPSRKLMDHCKECGSKNHLRATYCNDCGAKLFVRRVGKDDRGRAKLHSDIAHPINSTCRDLIQAKVLDAYELEIERSQKEGYVPQFYDDISDYETEVFQGYDEEDSGK